mmetsp:Transcript_30186/g.85108  ORF Transcript_30186/g.85108 Transcript_30186/m.85108 type:complete len:135 (+) Transcript_30186:51-455(+)
MREFLPEGGGWWAGRARDQLALGEAAPPLNDAWYEVPVGYELGHARGSELLHEEVRVESQDGPGPWSTTAVTAESTEARRPWSTTAVIAESTETRRPWWTTEVTSESTDCRRPRARALSRTPWTSSPSSTSSSP